MSRQVTAAQEEQSRAFLTAELVKAVREVLQWQGTFPGKEKLRALLARLDGERG
jgi:hypothetical protein